LVAPGFGRDVDGHGQGQVVGERGRYGFHAAGLQVAADQDVVDGPVRAPAGEGRHHAARGLQPRLLVQHLHFRALGQAVEIAHQHCVRVVGQQLGDEAELRHPRTRAQRQVGHGHGQAVLAIAELGQQHAAPADAAGQGVVLYFHRFQLAQQPVGAGCHSAHAPVRLVAPVIEAGTLGQVVGLVGEARPQAARVGLLQADDVMAARQGGDRVQAAALASRRQRM